MDITALSLRGELICLRSAVSPRGRVSTLLRQGQEGVGPMHAMGWEYDIHRSV
jgi:hypothetical protein